MVKEWKNRKGDDEPVDVDGWPLFATSGHGYLVGQHHLWSSLVNWSCDFWEISVLSMNT